MQITKICESKNPVNSEIAILPKFAKNLFIVSQTSYQQHPSIFDDTKNGGITNKRRKICAVGKKTLDLVEVI